MKIFLFILNIITVLDIDLLKYSTDKNVLIWASSLNPVLSKLVNYMPYNNGCKRVYYRFNGLRIQKYGCLVSEEMNVNNSSISFYNPSCSTVPVRKCFENQYFEINSYDSLLVNIESPICINGVAIAIFGDVWLGKKSTIFIYIKFNPDHLKNVDHVYSKKLDCIILKEIVEINKLCLFLAYMNNGKEIHKCLKKSYIKFSSIDTTLEKSKPFNNVLNDMLFREKSNNLV